MPESAAHTLKDRFTSLQHQIEATLVRSGRAKGDARLLAVSKTHSADRIEELYQLGQRDFGENYAQELAEKAKTLQERGCSEIRWHFIGHLQTNKAKLVAPWLWAIHSLDSEKLALELAKRRLAAGCATPLRAFLEVNLDGEASKSGLNPATVPELAARLASQPELNAIFQWEGLMAIPNPNLHADPAIPFRELRILARQLPPSWHQQLSMGMSADYEPALREGSHWIRVGTALFGSRV